MRCSLCQEILSSALDGEATAVEVAAADRHVATCPTCRAYAAGTTQLHRAVRLVPAEPVPDLTAGILAATASAQPDPADRAVRLTLAAVAVVQIVLAVPALLLGTDAGLPMHTARHLGSFDIALAVGFLAVAWRPRRALSGVLPVAAALVLCLVASTAVDLVAGRTGAVAELNHVTEIVGVVAMWLMLPRRVHHRSDRKSTRLNSSHT